MPTIGSTIKFKAGLYEDYAAITSSDIDVNTIYFCTDTQQLFVGDTEYTRKIQTGEGAPTAQSASSMPVGTLYYDSTNQVLYSNLSNSWTAVSDKNAPIDITGETVDLNDLVLDDVDMGVRYYFAGDGRALTNTISNTPHASLYCFIMVVTKELTYLPCPPYPASSYNIQICQTLYSNDGEVYRRSISRTNNQSSYNYGEWEETWSAKSPATYYGYCDASEASKNTKVIVIDEVQNFNLIKGVTIGIKFAADNTYVPTGEYGYELRFKFTKDDSYAITGNYYSTTTYKVFYNGNDSVYQNAPSFVCGIANHINYYIYDGFNFYWIGTDRVIDTTYDLATQSTDGLMSASDKAKVDAIPDNPQYTDTTYSEATTSSSGLMSASDKVKVDAIPANPQYTDTTYSTATQSTDGLMSSTDKTKLDGITPANLLTNSDIVVCTQAEYDAMSTRTGMLYIITEGASS